MSKQEAGVYIENLIEAYGSFNYAKFHTTLDENKLNRHLYDMIPGAFKNDMLENKELPSPASKIASAIRARRMTIGSMFASGHSRRKSLAFESDPEYTVNQAASLSKKRKFSDVLDSKDLKRSSKNGFVNNHQKKMSAGNANGSPVRSNSLSGRSSVRPDNVQLSEIFRARKSFPNANCMPDTLIPLRKTAVTSNESPINLNDAHAFPHRPLPEPSGLIKEEQLLLDDQDSIGDLVLHFSGSDEVVSPQLKIEHESEIVTLCNAMLAGNPHAMSKYINSSIESTLDNLMADTNPAQQIQLLQNELEKQRTEYGILFSKYNQLANENTQTINKNTELTNENRELIEDLANVNLKLSVMEMENVELTTNLTKLEAINIEQISRFKIAKAAIEEECKVEQAKSIAETKKKQWCAACGMSCGRYYCSSECKKNYM